MYATSTDPTHCTLRPWRVDRLDAMGPVALEFLRVGHGELLTRGQEVACRVVEGDDVFAVGWGASAGGLGNVRKADDQFALFDQGANRPARLRAGILVIDGVS